MTTLSNHFEVKRGEDCRLCGVYVNRGRMAHFVNGLFAHAECTEPNHDGPQGYSPDWHGDEPYDNKCGPIVSGMRKGKICNKCNLEHREDQECF